MTTEGPLEAEISRRTAKGWQLVSRQPNEAQMRKGKHFSFLWAVFWFVVGFGVGFICYLLWHWAKRDQLVYLRLKDGQLLISERKGILGPLKAAVVGYWRWAGRRGSNWGKGLAYAGPVAVVLVLITIMAAASAGGGSKEEAVGSSAKPNQPTAAGTPAAAQEAEKPTQTPEPAKPKNEAALTVGAGAEAEGIRIAINQILDPYSSENMFDEPDAGMRFVAFDLTVENVSDSSNYFSAFEFKLRDADDFQYEVGISPLVSPRLESQDLRGGTKTRGLVGFQVRATARLVELYFDPNLFTKTDILFKAQ